MDEACPRCDGRKRPRKEPEQQQEKEEKVEDVAAAATPNRRVIKLNSIKELRAEIVENRHTGEHSFT